MNIGEEIFNNLIEHCGDIKNIKGVTEQALKNMRDGKNFPTRNLLKKIYDANDLKAEITLKVDSKKGVGAAKIKLL